MIVFQKKCVGGGEGVLLNIHTRIQLPMTNFNLPFSSRSNTSQLTHTHTHASLGICFLFSFFELSYFPYFPLTCYSSRSFHHAAPAGIAGIRQSHKSNDKSLLCTSHHRGEGWDWQSSLCAWKAKIRNLLNSLWFLLQNPYIDASSLLRYCTEALTLLLTFGSCSIAPVSHQWV